MDRQSSGLRSAQIFGLLGSLAVLAACGGSSATPGAGSQMADSPAVPTVQGGSGGAEDAAATITADDILHRVGVIAHDSMRGRDTPSPELDQVARWAAQEFADFGLEPGGDDGGFIQRYPVTSVSPDFAASAFEVNGTQFAFGPDISLPWVVPAAGDVSAELVLVTGSGEWDRLVASGDVAGRHVILVTGSGQGGIRSRAVGPFLRGVLGSDAPPASILLASSADDAAWQSGATAAAQRTSTTMGAAGAGPIPVLEIRDGVIERLLGDGTTVADLRSQTEINVRSVSGSARLVTGANVDEATAPNTVGILRGSDPTLSDEAIVFSAHMDHVGVGRPDESGDSIYNGADDDASGTATIVELAEAYASMDPAPARSMVFVLVSGEEKGLWGSAYYADNPAIPTEQTVANLNADMVGRNWSDTIVVIGQEHSDLGETLNEVVAEHPELGMAPIQDLWPEQNFYGRSDHFNFARKGIPILFFFNGTHDDYHRPSDEVELIDGDKTARIGRLMFYLGLEVANRATRPQWDPESKASIVGR